MLAKISRYTVLNSTARVDYLKNDKVMESTEALSYVLALLIFRERSNFLSAIIFPRKKLRSAIKFPRKYERRDNISER